MHELDTALALLGLVMLLLGATSGLVKSRWYVSEPVLALAVGIVAGPCTGLLRVPPDAFGFLEQACRLTLAVAVLATALRLPAGFIWRRRRSVGVMIGLLMPGMWLVTSLLAYLIVGLSLPEAAVVGAVLTPTDPVIASSILTGALAEENLPARLRHTLSAEAGANDALASPLVLLPLIFVADAGSSSLTSWCFDALVKGVVVGGVMGGLVGYATGRAVLWVRGRFESEPVSHLSVSLAMAALLVGSLSLVGSNELWGVFVAGIAFRSVTHDAPELRAENIHQTLERMFLLPVFVLFGALLPYASWLKLGSLGLLFAVSVLLLRRLPLMLLLHRTAATISTPREARFAGWFGPIGIAALYYATLIARRAERPELFALASLVVTGSVFAHGVSATWLVKRFGQRQPGSAQGPVRTNRGTRQAETGSAPSRASPFS
ncbi:MAG: cation:proton antiporter [Myxococcales bacterium]|nr:cation:proton antiporter [Myxococcales bacterium]MCB9578663.1 cation:proton antiporter [Polyangiaceae bacterium]